MGYATVQGQVPISKFGGWGQTYRGSDIPAEIKGKEWISRGDPVQKKGGTSMQSLNEVCWKC